MMVFLVTDAQETWLYEDIESALEHIRQGVLHRSESGDEYSIELKTMTEAETAALPVH
jgi:hypothetical protein